MKYVSISPDDTLVSLTEKVGRANINQLLADNGLPRVPNIGDAWAKKTEEAQRTSPPVPTSDKINILNSLIPNSDIYEMAALSGANTWKVLAETNAFPGYLYVSDQIESELPESYNLMGNGISVKPEVYNAVNDQLLDSGAVDDAVFNVYDINDVPSIAASDVQTRSDNPMSWFKIPQNEVMLYSSLTDTAMSIPAYPEQLTDNRSASYTAMPDLLYQYEPWQMYQGSGPKTVPLSFHLHRDMWTGDHRDGMANELIRFCQAQLYAQYNGAFVHTSKVSLYVSGSCVVTGVMTSCNVDWKGPIGQDGYYLEFTLSFDITEVSKEPLNHSTVRSKGLIG